LTQDENIDILFNLTAFRFAFFRLGCLNIFHLITVFKMEAKGTAETLVSFYRMLGCVDWWSVTDIAGQYIVPIFKSQVVHSSSSLKDWLLEDGTGKHPRHVGACLPINVA
jgi:uncharacterized membrane protein